MSYSFSSIPASLQTNIHSLPVSASQSKYFDILDSIVNHKRNPSGERERERASDWAIEREELKTLHIT